MSLTKNSDYVGEGQGRLLARYIGLPRWDALLSAYLTECQAVEDAMWDVWVDRVLQSNLATGDLLAKLGALVGQTALGLNDVGFRTLITARIATNRSNGRREELINIATLLIPNLTLYVAEGAGSVTIMPYGPVPISPYIIGQAFLGQAVAAGIALFLIWASSSWATTFVFGSTYGGVSPTADQSPSSIYGGTTGGNLAGIVSTQDGSV